MSLMYRIIHFTPDLSFSRKFLFHPTLNDAENGVYYFSIGRSGYQHDRAGLRDQLREYLRAVRLLAAGCGSVNQKTIAYCHTTRFAFPGLLLCRLFGIGQVVYFNHGVPYIGQKWLMRWLLRLIDRASVATAHRFITVSPAMVSLLQSGPDATPWIHSIRPGSSSGLRDSEYLSREQLLELVHGPHSSRGKRYMYAGRLHARKGVFVLLEAWRSHVENYPDDELWLCGFSAQELSAKGAWLDVPGVLVRGYVSDMRSIYDAVDVVVSPSFHEGFGYTLLEGAARGCCIVSSSVPGPDVMFTPWMREQVFNTGNAEDLAVVMSRLSGSSDALARGRLLSFRSALRFRSSRLTYPNPLPMASE